ncbi:MAG: hypothetical protein EP312_02325 [Gammaproteobacteria bacterium]|nr:MAG: hypothetical protein EP312_02325 [Gammaproteobacteria bacterium]
MRHFPILGFALLLAACASQPVPAPVPEASAQQRWIAQVLTEAEVAFMENRLMVPVTDNAVDRYQQVLDIDPANEHALLGMKKVGRRYLSLAMEAANGGDLVAAQRYVDRAKTVDPGYEAIAHMEDYLALLETEQRRDRAKQTRSKNTRPNERWLDASAVSARSAGMVAELHDLARQIQAWDTRFEIIARSDAEGRWIYQTMRDAVSGYRLRANLSIGREPRVLLMDVIEATDQ